MWDCMNVPQFQQRTSPFFTSSLQPGQGISSSGASTRPVATGSTAARFSSKTKLQFGHWAVSGRTSDLHDGQAMMDTDMFSLDLDPKRALHAAKLMDFLKFAAKFTATGTSGAATGFVSYLVTTFSTSTSNTSREFGGI